MNKNKKLLLLILILVGVVSAIAFMYSTNNNDDKRELISNPPPTVTVFECNTDGKICPDGSVVGRSGKECQFASCPTTIVPTPTKPYKNAVLYGTVTLSPICPVERIPREPQCAPKPYITEVTAFDETTFELVASTKTTSSGNFVLDLLPGNYTIRAKDGAVYPRCEEKVIRLLENSTSSITLSCDTGIR